MAYDAIRQRHPHAPCAVGARVREAASGRTGTLLPPRPGDPGLRVHFDGQFPPVSCDPDSLEYADPPPEAAPDWCAR
ncbi:hypothetical protein [Methylobacterium gossipiicola]|uniref:Uncharacterized protein n=1 Tax=Methylobacterium gossipiicola TaxID=582675 RepID=A0A1I2VVU2_9HYPH|nr:hypothetical protein [Methylobacterium gossipiicola]SFG92569.1 hypothetical protein SAMN05192565_11769 [Methylobacterium gossipiicola]